MNEWFKRLIEQLKNVWSQWKPVQKVIFFGVIGVSLLGIVLLVTFSAAPSTVPLLTTPIQDPQLLSEITTRLDQEGVRYNLTEDNRILMEDERIAQRMRSVLAREDLIPPEADPWELFDMERWTITDFERNVNLQRSIMRQLESHITALEDVDAASVTVVIPEDELFTEQQDPVTASVIITPKPSSEITTSRAKIQGIERLIQFAVPGLQPDNITITDRSGVVLNDFENMEELDRLTMTERELEIKNNVEQRYKEEILRALSNIYTRDRVEVLNINVELDMGKRTEETTEHYPITTVPDNPQTPFSEREYVLSIPRSTETLNEDYEGTGFNPEGPPGVEGQTPPAYRDLEGLVGRYNNSEERVNNEINTRRIYEEKSPEINRITASVALDGSWSWTYNDRGDVELTPDGSIQREYTAVSDEQLTVARELVQDAVGYDADRGDSVTVRHVQFDRSAQFNQEDERFRRQQQIQMIVLYVLIGIAVLLIAFIVFRLISREIERRKRLREEELARQHQAMREAALRSAEEESAEVEMSVEERARMEMQENAVNMAREHPEDVAQLIRTWLAEE